jgi:hypothetical protein
MVKKKRDILKDVVSLDTIPEDIHVRIDLDWPARRIRMATDGRSHSRATCTRCDDNYAYTGKNPQYCPACLSYLKSEGRA